MKKKALDEQKAIERKEQEEQKAWKAEQAQRAKDRKQFREITEGDIHKRDASTRRLQQQYNTLQIILLIFSAVTATMAGIDGVARAWVAVTGVIATIAGSLLTTFKIQDRIYANHKAAAELRLECQKYDYRIEDYKDVSVENAFIRFSRAVNIIQGEQMLQEVELWNPKPKSNEDKKAQVNEKAVQLEEGSVEQVQVVEVSEEHVTADRLTAPDEHLGENHEQIQGSASEDIQKPL